MGTGSSTPDYRPAVVVVRQAAKQFSVNNTAPSKATKETPPGEEEQVNPSSEPSKATKETLSEAKEKFNPSSQPTKASKETLSEAKERMNPSSQPSKASKQTLSEAKERLNPSSQPSKASKETLSEAKERLNSLSQPSKATKETPLGAIERFNPLSQPSKATKETPLGAKARLNPSSQPSKATKETPLGAIERFNPLSQPSKATKETPLGAKARLNPSSQPSKATKETPLGAKERLNPSSQSGKASKETPPGTKEKVNPSSKQDGEKGAQKTDQDIKKEADAVLKTQLSLYKQTKALKSSPKKLTTAMLKEHVKAVRKSYSSFNDFPYDLKRTFRGKLFAPLLDSGTFALVCDTLKDGLETNAYLATNTNTNTNTTTENLQGTDNDEAGKNQVDLKDQKDRKDQKDQTDRPEKINKESETDTGDKRMGSDQTKEADKDRKDGHNVDKITKDGQKNGTAGKKGEQNVDTDQVDILKNCLLVLTSFAGIFPAARKKVASHNGFLPFLLDKLDQWCQPHVQGTTMDVEDHFVNRCLLLMYHIARSEDESHVEKIRKLDGFFTILKKYLSSKIDENRLQCIGSLAALATDKEAETISAESDIVRFLIKQLREAVTNKSRSSSSGWTITGLCTVVKNLARNDANKQMLVKEGAVPLLTIGLKPEKQKSADNSERKSVDVASVVKNLARNDANKQMLVKEGAVPLLTIGLKPEKQKSANKTERKSCLECLWWLSFDAQNREVMIKNKELMDIAVDIYTQGPKKNSHFPEAEGFVFQMRHTMKENDKYKDIKAEYAFMRSKTIIPLKLEKGYSPDDWLGIILGSKFYYDFTQGGKELQDKRQKLLEAVNKAYALEADTSDGKQVTAKSTSQPVATPKSTMTFEDKVKTWSKKDVEAWRNKFSLKGKEVEALSGEDIIYLFNLKSEAPEVFHASVNTDLALTSISAKASLNRALDRLPDVAADVDISQ